MDHEYADHCLAFKYVKQILMAYIFLYSTETVRNFHSAEEMNS
jgi:hypothetical protein